MSESLSAEAKRDQDFFESLYRERDDPWKFATSPYEQARFSAILEALRPDRFRHAFEPACSIGTLTVRLAAICDRVSACDLSQTAIDRARERCAANPHVEFFCAALTQNTPVQGYDLIILSEFGYYLDRQEWQRMIDAIAANLAPGAIILASHWLGRAAGHLQSAAEVHAALHAQSGLSLELQQIVPEFEGKPGFRLERFKRLPANPTA